MRWVFLLLLCTLLWCTRGAQAHDRNLSGLRVRLEPDSVVILVDTHGSTLGNVDPKNAVGDRLRLRLDGKPYVPVAPEVGLSQETDGVVWEDRIPYPVRSVEVLGTLYPENPKARLAVVIYDRDVAVRGAMLGPTLARWTFGKQTTEGKSAQAIFGESVRMLRERWSGYRNPWLCLVALSIFGLAGARPRILVGGILAGLCAGALCHRWAGIGIGGSLVEILTGALVALVSARVLAAPGRAETVRGGSALAVMLGAILGTGVGGSPGEGFPTPLEAVLDVAGTGLMVGAAVPITGWIVGRSGLAAGPGEISLRRSAAGLMLALAIGFGLLAQIPSVR